jgi:hypothetical protein
VAHGDAFAGQVGGQRSIALKRGEDEERPGMRVRAGGGEAAEDLVGARDVGPMVDG